MKMTFQETRRRRDRLIRSIQDYRHELTRNKSRRGYLRRKLALKIAKNARLMVGYNDILKSKRINEDLTYYY